MQCCNTPMSDFSFFTQDHTEGKVPHFYCTRCGSRHFRGKVYTAEEWFFYINEETYTAYCKRQYREAMDLDSPHAHELINHSNPEGDKK